MYAGLMQARAWDMLRNPDVIKHMNTESYMQLYRDAGYSEMDAQKAGNTWANYRLDAGLEP